MRAQGENLSQRTADTLRKMILEKETYTYGEKLPNENELSEKLGISRTTLREAIRTLVSEGILAPPNCTCSSLHCVTSGRQQDPYEELF